MILVSKEERLILNEIDELISLGPKFCDFFEGMLEIRPTPKSFFRFFKYRIGLDDIKRKFK